MMDFDKTYNKVKEVMTDAFQEIMANINAWLNDEFSTYANPRNTYTGGKEDLKPVIYDYIFHKKNVSKKITFLINQTLLSFQETKLNAFLDLAVAKSLQSTRMVTDADADDDDVQTTTGYTC